MIGVPSKKIQGGADQKYPPQHTEKMAPTWKEKTAHIEKYPHRGTPTRMKLFHSFSHAPPPGERLLFPPLRVLIMISTHFILFV